MIICIINEHITHHCNEKIVMKKMKISLDFQRMFSSYIKRERMRKRRIGEEIRNYYTEDELE